MKLYKVVGVSVAVFGNYRVLWEDASGFADREERKPATPKTLFQAGSISKSVASAGILAKAQAGAWSLEQDVNHYLKSWKVPGNEFTEKRSVTLERLLSHTAGMTVHGFPGYEAGKPVPTVPQLLDGAPPANTAPVRVDIEPGTRYRYSGGGYTVAQLAMTDAFGRTFPQLMAELVLKPAGMLASTYEQPLPQDKLSLAAAGYRSNGIPVPGKRNTYPEMAAAGLWTTAGDLARFAIALQKSLTGEQGTLLSKQTAERMMTPIREDYALGLGIEKHGDKFYFGHNGADEGFQAILLASRDGCCGAAIMVNSDNGIALGIEILRGIARESAWPGYLPEPIATIALPAAKLAGMSGRYQLNSDEAFTLEARGGRLFGRPLVGDEYEMFPISRSLFVRKDSETRYQIRNSGERVAEVLVLNGKEQTSAKRMSPGAKLPIDDLLAGRISQAIDAYRAIFAATPDDSSIAEGRINRMGYAFLARNEYEKAIAMLRLNTELYPSSSNTYDSLAEAYLASGDRVRSLETYRKVLEVLPTDQKSDPALKQQLQRNAESKVKELKP
jgi:CubicO group peptidase (beta-lactamase class C family)